jgi:hypothetical protein
MPDSENTNGDSNSSAEDIGAIKAQLEAVRQEAEAAKKALEEQKISVNVDGEDKVMTLEEAKAALSKVSGADKKFREAADLRKKAERGMKIDSLFAKLEGENPDQKDIMELAGLLGIDPAPFLKGGGDDPGTNPPPRKITLEDLSPELKQQLEFEAQRNIEAAEQKIRDEVSIRVDKDEIIGKMNSVAKEQGNEEFLDAVVDVVHEDVLRKISRGEPFGAGMIESSLQGARARFKKFGIPEKVSKPKTLIYGVGQPGGEPMSVQPDEPIERVESSEAGYADNFAKRAFQMLARGSTSKA